MFKSQSNAAGIYATNIAGFAGLTAAGVGAGNRIRISDLRYAEFYSDGTNFRPVSGRQSLYQRTSDLVTPLATTTGNSTLQFFTLPETLLIPAGLIAPSSKLYVEAWTRRTGASGAFTGQANFGTGNNNSDPSFLATTIANTTLNEWRMFGSARFFPGSTTSYISDGFTFPNQTGTTSSSLKNTQINTAASMYVNFGGNHTSPDTYSIYHYHVWIEG